MESFDEVCKMDTDLQALSPALQNSIKKIIEKANFIKYNVTVVDVNSRNGNVLGKLYEINVKGKTRECEKEINIFVKEKPILKSNKFFNPEQLYANEELMYKEISKILTSLQEEANVPPEERFKIAMAYDETNKDAIILENLCKMGFKTYSKNESLPLKFFELGIQDMAKLHALSLIIENKMPKYFKEKIAVIEFPFQFDEDWNELMRNICRYVANLYDDETKIKIENFVPVLLEKLPKYYTNKTNICTLAHGDYRKSNIMVRMNDGEPVEIVVIDYQTIDYGCAIRDLLFFIFTSTDQEFRKKHLDYLKELYFETLSRFLKYFNMDVETVYPRNEFEKVYTEWLDYGLMITLFYSIAMFAPETGLDVGNQDLAEIPFCPDKKYNPILLGLVDDFIQWGYL